MKKREYKINKMLEKNTTLDISDFESMNKQIKEVGKDGMLHFIIKSHKEGWIAQCEEIPGIVTGNTNSNPDQEEINKHIREAIFSAFNVNIKSVSKEERASMPSMIRLESTITI